MNKNKDEFNPDDFKIMENFPQFFNLALCKKEDHLFDYIDYKPFLEDDENAQDRNACDTDIVEKISYIYDENSDFQEFNIFRYDKCT